ncbi:MAG: hypothetical protein ACK578_09695, partial [Pirellula sp.]
RLGIQPTSHTHRSCLQKDYHVARPHGILAATSTNAAVYECSGARITMSLVDVVMLVSTRTHLDHRSTPTSGLWWRFDPLLVSGCGYCSPQASCVVALCYRGDALLHHIAMTRHVVALYAVSWTTLENWSEYFLKNVRTKKRQEGIFQSWFDFDRKVPIEVVYQLSDSVTRITICPEYPAILRHQLPVPDW